MSLIDDLSWRYAVKKFEPGVRVDSGLAQALEAARLAPSSFGLQPWRIVAVEDPALRRALRAHAFGAAKVEEAGHLLIFAHLDPLAAEDVDAHVALMVRSRGLDAESAARQRQTLHRAIFERKDEQERRAWTRAQTYIGLGVFLAACAQQRLDACPMEGFEPQKVDEMLDLSARRLHAAAFVTAGRRAVDDAHAELPKVRMPLDDLVHVVR